MQPRLLRTTSPATQFEALFGSATETGFQIGWLDLEEALAVPEHLDLAVESGAMRAVGVEAGRVVAAKSLAGEPVLRDLVREHFTGCRLLLVRGCIEAPEIFPEAGGWRVRWADGVERELSTEAFLTELRRPGFP